MEEKSKIWNYYDIAPPVINSYNAKSSSIDLKSVLRLFQTGICNLKLEKMLHRASKIIRKCGYRMKLQFRNDKGYSFIKKTNVILIKLINFNLIGDLENFYKSLPKKYSKEFYLPTKQMLEYVLIRIQAYSQILVRVVESTTNVAEFMNNRLILGHLWITAAVVLAEISRVWQITKELIKECCKLYDSFLPLRDKFKLIGVKWLDDNYEFPSNLEDWLNAKWLYSTTIFESPNNIKLDLPIFNVLDESDNEIEYCGQYKLHDFVIDCEKVTNVNVEEANNDDIVSVCSSSNNTIEINDDVHFISSSPISISNLKGCNDNVCSINSNKTVTHNNDMLTITTNTAPINEDLNSVFSNSMTNNDIFSISSTTVASNEDVDSIISNSPTNNDIFFISSSTAADNDDIYSISGNSNNGDEYYISSSAKTDIKKKVSRVHSNSKFNGIHKLNSTLNKDKIKLIKGNKINQINGFISDYDVGEPVSRTPKSKGLKWGKTKNQKLKK